MTVTGKTAAQRAREKWADQQAKVDAQRRAPEPAPAQPGSAEQPTLPGMPAPSAPQHPPCHHCGTRVRPITDRLCEHCRDIGADPIWIPCTIPGHDHVQHRRRIGQTTFTCTPRP
ncbi:hypothetical protein JRG18_12300 [Kocuria palustris]|uniref:hypothetical protein n=1 Tax=Kocuria palustris TaxID=71999 RepID=UPI0019CFC943|nr:hypothetical protein [Kocuria palustris]MBN6754262.1 hypothetical protein [Kocuria palustris]MBN6759235.1 hypothetical protein [Kocuria palustris]MBN6764275.1 hypothetical protein [Kocuria palustris]MBN6783760.1 hypothetical protein [Kocuria palustris]MBN6800242.1 hypothetical protein [Kocuria palustris]